MGQIYMVLDTRNWKLYIGKARDGIYSRHEPLIHLVEQHDDFETVILDDGVSSEKELQNLENEYILDAVEHFGRDALINKSIPQSKISGRRYCKQCKVVVRNKDFLRWGRHIMCEDCFDRFSGVLNA